MNFETQLNSFHVRNFRQPDDISRLLSLLEEAEAVDASGEDISESAVRAQLEVPGHDPQEDRWVVEHPTKPDTLIGHAAIYVGAHDGISVIAEANLVVHPLWRQRGLGSTLFSSAMNRARTLGANHIRLYADRKHEPFVQFMKKKRLVPVATYTEMRSMVLNNADLLPSGFTILPYTVVSDPLLLVAAYNTCYAEQWGHHQVTLERIEKSLPHINADGLFMMFSSDHTLAGMCRSGQSKQRTERNGQTTGYIDAPGVIPALRAPHLYGALLLHAAKWLRENNSIIELESWGDAPETIELYRELGFELLRQQDAYQGALEHEAA